MLVFKKLRVVPGFILADCKSVSIHNQRLIKVILKSAALYKYSALFKHFAPSANLFKCKPQAFHRF